LPIAGKVDGQDDSKAGKVTVISSATDTVTGTVTIDPIADTGFKATGDAIERIPPGDPANPANFIFTTGAYPNQLNNIAIKNHCCPRQDRHVTRAAENSGVGGGPAQDWGGGLRSEVLPPVQVMPEPV
jgi:hypothetical protein